MTPDHFIFRLKEALKKELPGVEVQWEMSSSDRRIEDFPRNKRADSKLAAVLILLYPLDRDIHTLFIQRPVYNGVHSGQISFPGGKREETDNDLTETAIREAYEETGLCSEDIMVLGRLTPLFIPVSNIEVTPIIAFLHKKPEYTPSPDEVVYLIEADLLSFFSPGIIKERPMKVRNELIDVKYFDYKGHVIWGATAMILYELLVVVERENIELHY